MMENVKEWAVSLCGAAVLCAAVGMISPDGKTGKCIKLVLGLVVLCLMLSPLSQIDSCTADIEEYISQPAEADRDLLRLVEEQSAQAITQSVKALIEEQLEGLGINAQEIIVNVDISDDGCITISQAEVTIQRAGYDLTEMECTLNSAFGFEVILREEAADNA